MNPSSILESTAREHPIVGRVGATREPLASLRRSSRSIRVAATAGLLALTIGSCSTNATEDPATQPTSSTPSSSVEQTPTPVATDSEVTCDGLLNQATITELEQAGLADVTAGVPEPTSERASPSLEDVVKFGGIKCVWAEAGTEGLGSAPALSYGYGPIGEADAKEMITILQTHEGLQEETTEYGRLFSDNGEGTFAFADGYWAISRDGGAGGAMEDLLQNAPGFISN